MDNNVLNSLQLYKSKYLSDLLEENNIANALQYKRSELSTTLRTFLVYMKAQVMF